MKEREGMVQKQGVGGMYEERDGKGKEREGYEVNGRQAGRQAGEKVGGASAEC